MKVIQSNKMDLVLGSEATVLTLDERLPLIPYKKILIDGKEYEQIYYSQRPPRFDVMAIRGLHDLDGQTVEFI